MVENSRDTRHCPPGAAAPGTGAHQTTGDRGMNARHGRWATWSGLLVLALVLAGCSRAPVATTVILVRHAERPSGADPELSADGRARAESLAVALARTEIHAIIHTQFRRTQQTAQPLATQKGLTPIVLTATGPESLHTQAV